MNHFMNGFARAVAEAFDLPGPILEIGSYQVPGQEGIANLRSLFPGKEYLGLDMRQGPGVDCVANVEQLPQANASAGSILALNTFEHVAHFWRGFEEIRRVLRNDGVLVVSCPFYFHIHAYPSDYWRFTPEALNVLLPEYPQKILGWHGPARRPLNVWAIAFREDHPPVTTAQFEHYKDLVGRYSQPRWRWGRWLRYQTGRLLCGRRPFAPYLDRERWQSECLNRNPQDQQRRDEVARVSDASPQRLTKHAAAKRR